MLNLPQTLPDGARIRCCPQREFGRVLPVFSEAFPDVSLEFFEAIALNDPWYNPNFTLVVEKDGEIVSHVQIFDRTIVLNQIPFRLGGIGSVGTRDSARGCGYATALMNTAVQMMKQAGMQAAILFTGIHDFYKKFGWQTLTQREFSIPTQAVQFSSGNYTLRVLRDDDYPVQHAIYESMQKQVDGLLVRTLDYWRMRPTWLAHLPMVIEQKGRIAGYFFASQYRKNQPILTITELGLSDDTRQTAAVVLKAIAQKTEALGCHTFQGFFRHHPLLGRHLDDWQLPIQESEFQYLMWLDLNADRFDEVQRKANQCRFLYWQTDAL